MFDLDGTLIDTMGAFADVAAATMVELHAMSHATARRRYLETSGIPFRQQLELIAPGHPSNDVASQRFEQRKLVHAETADLDEPTTAALERLRVLGIKLVVSSNSAHHLVEAFARRQRFTFDLVLGFDADAGLAKGASHVERVCAAFGVGRDDLVFCGDSLKDGELAIACGIAFVARLGTFSREDFRRWNPSAPAVCDIAALTDLLGRIAA